MQRWLRVLCLGMLGSPLANPAFALEFTADQITKIDGRTHKASIYYRDQMWRIEHHSLGPVNVTIVRKDKQLVWLLLSRMKHFKTLPYDPEQDLHVRPVLEGEIERQEIGTEVREGHPTTLYEVPALVASLLAVAPATSVAARASTPMPMIALRPFMLPPLFR